MKARRTERGIKLARRQAVRDSYVCSSCGVYKSTAAIRRFAEELPVDLRDADNWLAVCEYCRVEAQAERQALRRAGIALTDVASGVGEARTA